MTWPETHPTFGKSEQSVAAEWDALASRRSGDIENGKDLSFLHVLTPAVLSLLKGHLNNKTVLLDVGCGTGNLTAMLAKSTDQVVGIDPSIESIKIARRSNSSAHNIDWINQSVQELANEHYSKRKYDVIVANMVLMDTLDLEGTLDAISRLAAPRALLVWTITHPSFWPSYWGYDTASWYDYNSEIQIESEFRSYAGSTGFTTTHVHRPLSTYMNTFVDNNFAVEEIREPTPSGQTVPSRYTATWKFPRFLSGRCRKM